MKSLIINNSATIKESLNRIENKEVQGKRKMLTKRISSEIFRLHQFRHS